MPATVHLLRFGAFELDPAQYLLRLNGRPVRLSNALMELLLLLVGRPGELVTREQIVAALWTEPRAVDVQQGINTAIARLRAALGDDPAQPRFIETVIGRGYRFIGTVEEVDRAAPEPAPARDGKAPEPAPPAPQLAATPAVPTPAAPATRKPRRGAWLAATLLAGALAGVLAIAWAIHTRSARPEPSSPRQLTFNDAEHPVTAAALSSDGTLLAYVDDSGIFVEELATGRTRLLNGPALRPTRLAWFADGSRLLLTGFPAGSPLPEIWALSATGGPAHLFHRGAAEAVPAPDGRAVAFTVDGGRELRVATPEGASERSVTRGGEGEVLSAPFWSPDSQRLGFQKRSAPQNPGKEIELSYAWSYHSVEAATGRETVTVPHISFDSAGETADGTLFFLRSKPAIDRAHNGVYRVKTDPATGAFLSTPVRLPSFEPLHSLWTGMSVSRAGALTALEQDWRQNLYVGNLGASGKSLSGIQRLTTRVETDFPYSWSPDSESVYVEGDRRPEGSFLYRQRVGSANSELLAPGVYGAHFPTLMPDGQTLLYEVWRGKGTTDQRAIFRAHADGSHPELVLREGPLDDWRCPMLKGSTCVLRKTEGQNQFAFYTLAPGAAPGAALGPELARTPWQPSVLGDWALSPDGATAAIPNHDGSAPTILLLPLNGRAKPSVMEVGAAAQLWGIHWAADGKGFFAEVRDGPARRLVYITLAGQLSTLRETTGDSWAAPSRDGRKLAFAEGSYSANVYLSR